MQYRLQLLPSCARKDWKKLPPDIKVQFEKKLRAVLSNPHIPKNKLRDLPNCYKIKLKQSGYRLVYRVDDDRVVVIVVSVGRRDKFAAYALAEKRL